MCSSDLGHTPGSIGLLDSQTGELFTGDAITSSGVLLHLEESLPMSTYMQTLQEVQELIDTGNVTTIYGGHGDFNPGTGVVQKFIDGCTKISVGNLTDKEKKNERIVFEGLEISFDLNRMD